MATITRPRVLHIAESLYAGVGTTVADYVSHDVAEHFVLAHSRGHSVSKAILESVSGFYDLPPGHVRRIRAVRSVIEAVRPHIVHAHSSLGGLYARLLPFPRRQIIYSPHCFAFERRDVTMAAKGLLWTVEALLALRTGTFAAVSEHEALLARGLPGRAETRVVPHTIGHSLAPATFAVKRNPSQLRIVTSGRVCPQKDPRFFAAAAKLDRTQPQRNEWTWVGGGDPALERTLREAGVRVTGLIEREAAVAKMSQADVYVHTAKWEAGIPLAVLEAASLGLPVVVRWIAAMSDLTTNFVRTPSDLVTTVSELRDSDAWASSAQLSMTLATQHSPASQRRALQSLYHDIAVGLSNATNATRHR